MPTRYPAAERVVAIGDVHGDLNAARRALILAGAIDDQQDRWIGGELVVVHTGDILDRGDNEREILDLFARLATQAQAAGGGFYRLLGNHETMNVRGDFHYVTAGGFAAFGDVSVSSTGDPRRDAALARGLAALPAGQRGRAAALWPGGAYARMLTEHNTVIVVGDTAFAHGGVLPAWADYGIERINAEIRCWLAGATDPPALLAAADNPLWNRDYATSPERCDQLDQALTKLGAARMVVGHTPQKSGITSACRGKVWRIDSGMSSHYRGPTEVLEIRNAAIRVIRPASSNTPAAR